MALLFLGLNEEHLYVLNKISASRLLMLVRGFFFYIYIRHIIYRGIIRVLRNIVLNAMPRI